MQRRRQSDHKSAYVASRASGGVAPEIAVLCEQPGGGVHHIAAATAADPVGLLEQAPLLALKHVPDAAACEGQAAELKLALGDAVQRYVVHDVGIFEVAYAAREEEV